METATKKPYDPIQAVRQDLTRIVAGSAIYVDNREKKEDFFLTKRLNAAGVPEYLVRF